MAEKYIANAMGCVSWLYEANLRTTVPLCVILTIGSTFAKYTSSKVSRDSWLFGSNCSRLDPMPARPRESRSTRLFCGISFFSSSDLSPNRALMS
jgi:hypothetical protein